MNKPEWTPIVPVAEHTPQTQTAPLVSLCPTCGARMKDSRCKLICKQCGFFLSCADFY